MMNDSFLDKSESHTEREGFTSTDLDEGQMNRKGGICKLSAFYFVLKWALPLHESGG